MRLELDLDTTPEPPCARLPSLRRRGFVFFTLAEAGDGRETHERLYELVREGVLDSPGFQGEFESFPEFMARIYRPSYWRHRESQFLAAIGGDWVGLSSLAPGTSDVGDFGLTVVTERYRGNGLAGTLKELAIRHALGLGIRRLTATTSSPRMLAINRRLGFRTVPDRRG